jgi:signal transduction histidine kinase
VKGQIKNRLIVALLLVAAVPLVGVGLYSIYSNSQALRALALTAARERAELKAREVEELLRDMRGDLFFLARSPMLYSLLDELGNDPQTAAFWRAKLGQQFLAFTRNKPAYTSLRYLDENGIEIVRAEHDGLRSWLVPDGRLEPRGTSEYFRRAVVLAAGEVFVTTADRGDGEAREPVLRYALRVFDRREQRRGVLVADVFARRVVEAVREGEEVHYALLDEAGQPLSPQGMTELAVDVPLEQVRARFLEGATAVLVELQESTVSWAPVWPDQTGREPMWLLMAAAPKSQVFASLYRFRLVFAGLVLAVILAALALSLLLAKRIAEPLAELRDGARRMGGGDLAHRIAVRGADEIGQVATEFNRMGEALYESYHRLQQREQAKSEQLHEVTQQLVESEKLAAVGQLAAGVAHEINNPMGIASLYVQQLLESGQLSAGQEQKLRIVERHAERVGRITQGLLDFARARQYRREAFDVAEIVRAAIEVQTPLFTAAQVEVALRIGEGSFAIVGDGEQVQQVFENLLRNAVQAIGRDGRIDVEIAQSAESLVVRIADSGPGIASEHIEHIFEPFFTTKEIGEGTGLGLAISYGTIKAHSGRMEAENRKEGGAVFSVFLPVEKNGELP